MIKETKFKGIFELTANKKKTLLTKNLVPGVSVYGERLISKKGVEYREWNPYKSKIAAAIMKGLYNLGITQGSKVLYLGCATGTTASHISDIVGNSGFIYALDFAPNVMREIAFLSEVRKNIMPIFADANNCSFYRHLVLPVDVIVQDVAQPNQAEIFIKNMKLFLKDSGIGIIAVKARSIDVAKKPLSIFNQVRSKIQKDLNVLEFKILNPYQKDHCIFVCNKKE